MYLDSAYIAKFYVNEEDSGRVRAAIAGADTLLSSMWAMGEVTCALHRHLREGTLGTSQYRDLVAAFLEDIALGNWTFIPVTERLLRKMVTLLGTLPRTTFLRAGDALHLTTALDLGEGEIWSSDRHLLTAAAHFGLVGRSA
ncbi:MAG: type II toxin-antitoxin system VapC family toxin [Acidobacteriia bacterium]|nr:type II toxin-antitoxin system VapC family toxin [Terriglobia bacterium]